MREREGGKEGGREVREQGKERGREGGETRRREEKSERMGIKEERKNYANAKEQSVYS